MEPNPKADYKGKVQGRSGRGGERGAKLKIGIRSIRDKILR